MEKEPLVLDFVKAVSHPDRLRVIGVLAQHPATTREVAAQLGMPFRKAFNHLGMLEFAGVVHKDGELFHLDTAALEQLSKQQLADSSPSIAAASDLDDKARRVLETFLKPEVDKRQLPAQAAKLRVVLEHVATAFDPAGQYSEKEVNTILRGFHPDVASLRRALVDAGLLARESDGSRYWRPSSSTNV